MKKILVTGTSPDLTTNSLGDHIANELRWQNIETISLPREQCDLGDPFDVIKFVDKLPQIDGVVNSAGLNKIDFFEKLSYSDWDDVFKANVFSIFALTKELLIAGKLNRGSAICNIVSNASHMPMTHSAAYNASKGAAHILTRQMARELKPRFDITVFGVSPNKLESTGMSKEIDKRVQELRGWTPDEQKEYQLKSLPAGAETDPRACAEFVAFLLSRPERHVHLNGCIMPYGA